MYLKLIRDLKIRDFKNRILVYGIPEAAFWNMGFWNHSPFVHADPKIDHLLIDAFPETFLEPESSFPWQMFLAKQILLKQNQMI